MADRICDNCMSRVPADAEKCPKCGILFENTNPGGALPNGWVLGERYTIGRYLELDGEGVTYSAIDSNTLQRVLVKEYMPVTLCVARDEFGSIVTKPGCEVLFKTTRMDFSELYSTMMRVGLAEGLVQVLDIVEENNTVYAVLEKTEGPTLTEYLMKQDAPMEPTRALSILRPVLLGVEAMHRANVVHRGISPDNIILESGGTAKLTGYATLALRQQGSELKSKLYPGYSAPEQYRAAEFEGEYTDIYALGAVLYRLVTGVVPPSADERRMQDVLQPARSVNKEVPNFLSTALSRTLRLAPAERIQTIEDLRMALSGEPVRAAQQEDRDVRRAPSSEAGGSEKKGPLGLSKQQLIVGGIALGAIVLLLIIVLIVSLVGGKDKTSSSSSSSSSISQSAQIMVPDFAGKDYRLLIQNREYTDIFTFDEVEEKYDIEVEEGKVISQTPAANTEWNGSSKIKLVVSLGAEPIAMPDYVTNETSGDDAKKQLEDKGFTNVVMVQQANSGQYKEGYVVKTDPASGTEVTPGKTQITIYVASAASKVKMPNLVGKSEGDVILELTNLGVPKKNIKINKVVNDGTGIGGRAKSTSPVADSEVIPGDTAFEVEIYDKYYFNQKAEMQGYVGRNAADLKNYLNQRSYYFTYNGPESGVIESINGIPETGAEVQAGTMITVTIKEEKPPENNGNNESEN